jgi:solute carrier family 31 (copper transporter), member 1
MDSAMQSTPSMPMPTAAIAASGSGMRMTMDMSTMSMAFFQSGTTTLFFQSWTPATTGQYAGTCIFLVTLGIITRVLLALKPILETTAWKPPQRDHHDSRLLHDEGEIGAQKSCPSELESIHPLRVVLQSNWRDSTFLARLTRAAYEVMLAGLGYFL